MEKIHYHAVMVRDTADLKHSIGMSPIFFEENYTNIKFSKLLNKIIETFIKLATSTKI